MQSMTGFVERNFSYKTFSVKITIKSLNHRFFDWNYRGSQVNEVENRLRALCQKKLHRGRIDVYLDLNFFNPSRWELKINEDLLSTIFVSLEKTTSRMKRNVSFPLENIFSIPHIAQLKRKNFSSDESEFLERCFEKTLTELIKVRHREGVHLRSDILEHVRIINQAVSKIERLGRKQPVLIRKRLRERLKELESETKSISEERLIEEAAYIAQRYDISEEIERLKSHLGYLRELLSSKEIEPIGKKLDFVAQELFREANTINSKAQNIEIIKECLTVKGELESIRQQVQNLE
jgi:uncharacterized protein (TIGR00255 family)